MNNRPFWQTRALTEMSRDEWESLCDGCGRCCLRKLEDEETHEIAYTDVACHLLDLRTCRCRNYPNRLSLVKDCVSLSPDDKAQFSWLPSTCAYRLLDEGKPLPDWHPLVSGSDQSVHAAGISVRGRCVSETHVAEEDVEDRIVNWISPYSASRERYR